MQILQPTASDNDYEKENGSLSTSILTGNETTNVQKPILHSNIKCASITCSTFNNCSININYNYHRDFLIIVLYQ